MELYEMKGSQDKVGETMSTCREDATKSVDACRLEAVSAYKKSEGIDAGATVDPAEFQDTLDKGFNSGVKDRISACILAADGVAEVEDEIVRHEKGRRLLPLIASQWVAASRAGSTLHLEQRRERRPLVGKSMAARRDEPLVK